MNAHTLKSSGWLAFGLLGTALLSGCGLDFSSPNFEAQSAQTTRTTEQAAVPAAAPATPATPATTPPSAAPKAANGVQSPYLNVVITPQNLKKEGAVFFFITGRDYAGKPVARTQIFVDGKVFVDDSTNYGSYGKYFRASDNGTHYARIVVTDNAGLMTEQKMEFEVLIGAGGQE